MYTNEKLAVYQVLTVDGVKDKLQVQTFDFIDLDYEKIANDAQQRLVNLMIKRQTLTIEFNELLQCIQIPLIQELNRSK